VESHKTHKPVFTVQVVDMLIRIVFEIFYYSFASLVELLYRSVISKTNKVVTVEKNVKSFYNHQRSLKGALISIIIPCYNEERHLLRIIEAITREINVEVIISDGGSKDQTPMIASQLAQRFSNVKYVEGLANFNVDHINPCLGGKSRSQCQNIGASEASGDILLFLHADTVLCIGFSDEVRTTLSSIAIISP
jgi:cellulose synthase/poly-beta-1,6-N-acetylglucosamine synthase-like glycosyltransferase